MAIDQMMLGPMLDPFKTMADECTAKGCSGQSYDQMMAALHRMEQLGQEMDDFAAFSAKMTTENLQMDFSLAYGKVLSEAASGQSSGSNSGSDYDDAALLKQTIDALKNAVVELKKGEQAAVAEGEKHQKDETQKAVVKNEVLTLAKTDQIIAPIQALIDYGESGVNFPTFLRVQIERGLDKAMEGSAVLREGLEFDFDFAKAAAINPHNIAICEEKLAAFDELAAKSKFGVPNSISSSLTFNKIEASYVSKISKWMAVERAWERIFSLLDTWAIAHTKFAPHIEPWSMAANPKAAVEKDKATLPGIIQERMRLFSENFNLSFANILGEETFVWSVKKNHFSYSQMYTAFLLNSVLNSCKPGQNLDAEQAGKVEALYENKEMPNPENYKVLDRQEAAYNKHFGEGLFVQKAGPKPDFGERNAPAWSI